MDKNSSQEMRTHVKKKESAKRKIDSTEGTQNKVPLSMIIQISNTKDQKKCLVNNNKKENLMRNNEQNKQETVKTKQTLGDPDGHTKKGIDTLL